MSNELTIMNQSQQGLELLKQSASVLKDLMTSILQENEHYGIIPGCKKPSLLKSGAEKICTCFRLAPQYEIITQETGSHRNFQVICTLTKIGTSDVWGQGVGSCSTMETKYRYRDQKRKCPVCSKETIFKGKEENGGGWYCWLKQGGCGAKFADGCAEIESQPVGKIENPDLADQWNTVLKMAKKRALVDAVLTATAASDIFTQDVEEMQSAPSEPTPRPAPKPTAKPVQTQPPTPDFDGPPIDTYKGGSK